MFSTPIAYIVFNRPRHTRETFATIRARQPAKLFIIADGPRLGHPTDAERCQEVKEIVEQIDWPCEVLRDYAQENMGCKRRISSGLSWVFSKVDRAIVLEDDCLPHPDFYTFCDTLLERYKNDEHIWTITGNNFQDGRHRGTASYYFSKYFHCHGWATWQRSWQHFQGELLFWPEWKSSNDWKKKFSDHIEQSYWKNIFDKIWRNEIDSWAYPWTCCIWYHGGLTATPNVNLVSHIGTGPDATHNVSAENLEGVPVRPLGAITHPPQVKQDQHADRYVFNYTFDGIKKRWYWRMRQFPRRLINKVYREIKALFTSC